MVREKRRRQYGTGSIYQRASDGRWFGVLEAGYTKNGTRRRPTVSAKTEAEVKTKLKAKARALSRGDEGASNRVTVKTWAAAWLDETRRTVTPNAHTTDRAAVGWIISTIGHCRLDQLTPTHIREVRNAVIAAGNSTSTALRYHGTLIRLLKAAVEEGYAVPDRAIAIKGPSKAVSDRTAMSVEESLLMLAQAGSLPHGSRWLAAFLQGARQGECLGLTWPDVTGGVLKLEWQLQPLPYADKKDRSKGFRVPDGYEVRQLEGRLHLVRPKSKAGWRVAPIVGPMRAALDHWEAIAPPSPHGLVWPGADGRPRDENDDRAEWYDMQDAAGVRHPSGRHYFVHEARHTTATLLRALKVPEADRVAIMGHSSYASTIGYEHVDLTSIREALEQVAARLQLGG